MMHLMLSGHWQDKRCLQKRWYSKRLAGNKLHHFRAPLGRVLRGTAVRYLRELTKAPSYVGPAAEQLSG